MKASLWLLPLADICLNLMLVFAVLLRLSVMAINAETPKANNQSPPNSALYMVTLEWSGESRNDLDLYVQDPLKNLVFFKSLSSGLMALVKDDTGRDSNTLTTPSGYVVYSPVNIETVEIRGLLEGEYTANVHYYSSKNKEPENAVVTLYKTTGFIKVHEQAITMTIEGDEQTAFRFTLLKDGNVTDINRLQQRFTGK